MKTIIKNGIQITILTLAAMPLSYVIKLALSRNLSLEEFGMFYAILGFFTILQSINDLGFSEAQLYFIPRFTERKRIDKVKAAIKTQLFNQIFTTLLIGLALVLATDWITQSVFHSTEINTVFRLFILYFIASDFLRNVKVLFLSHHEADYYGVQEPIRILLTFVLVILAVLLFRLDLLVVTTIWFLVYFSLAIVYLFFFIKKHSDIFKAKKYPIKKIYKEFFPFLLPTLIANNIGTLFASITEMVLLVIKGSRDVGLYNIAKPIMNLAMAIIMPISNILKPYISKISENNNKREIRTIVFLILNAGVFALFPFSLILTFYSEESVVFLFGSQFIGASLPLKFLSFEMLFNIMNLFIYGIVFGLGLQKNKAKVIYYSSIIGMILSLILIPRFGSTGVALANLSYSIVTIIGGLIIIRKEIDFKIPLRNYFKILILGGFLLFTQALFKGYSPDTSIFQFVAFLLKIGLGLSLYFYLGIFTFKIVDPKIIGKMIEPYKSMIFKKIVSISK